MTPECTYILTSGRKCRGLAGNSQPFCRHHRPKLAGQRPVAPSDRYSPLARWRSVGRDLHWQPTAELPSVIFELLDALTQPGQAPSDRTIGRFLRQALTRLGHVPFPYPDLNDMPVPDAPQLQLMPTAPFPARMPDPQHGPMHAPMPEPMHLAPHAHPAPPAHSAPNANPIDLAQVQRDMHTIYNALAESQ